MLRFLMQHGNSIGLVCDIVGAGLLFFFGVPPMVNPSGRIFMTREMRVVGTDPAAIRRAKRYERLGRLGLILLIVGFALQFLSNCSPR
jgi:hypothetical protein